MRRWFKIGQDPTDGHFFSHTANETAIFLSMPFKDDLLQLLNSAILVNVHQFYSGQGDPGLCDGGDGTTPHLYVPHGDVHTIINNAGSLVSYLLNGFPNVDGVIQPPLLTEDFVPPSRNG